MQPGVLPLSVRQGDTLKLTITVSNPVASQPNTPGTPIDLTGAIAQLLIRAATVASTIQLAVTSAHSSTNASSLTLGGTAGSVAIVLSSADTMGLTTGSYDLRVKFADGTTQTYLTGPFTATREAEPWTAVQ